ncbi:Crossover junction endonuclease eme1 [Cyphellophora attinorum]|uniref:Crossover junction endonuclease eme1 n=1 Tax=Cyphellophora attinorum TaxID=1664694 RepID=A0A0N0NKH8_9EURO|nr:Crossover junction endonuclease eme1 [Phialophora attinorum]KPI38151.1 Crossover junction endonuclease eme1 [Phialophora attinorum]
MEIICIDSSPPVSPYRTAKVVERLRTSPRRRPGPSIYSVDDFDSTGDLEPQQERPTKRRRSSSPRSSARKTVDEFDHVFDLPAGWDAPSSSAPARSDTRKTRKQRPADIDDIEFTSSAPQPGTSRPERNEHVHILSSDSITADDIRPSQSNYSNLVDKVLGYTSVDRDVGVLNKNRKGLHPSEPPENKERDAADIIEFSSQAHPASGNQQAGPSARHRADTADKEAQKAAKEAEKEAEKRRKREARAEVEKEKQKAKDLAEVNKAKTNKKETSKEMILIMPGETQGLSLGNQVTEYMRQHDVQIKFADEEVTLDNVEPWLHAGKVVQWKRKVQATYNEDEGQWMPTGRSRTEDESHIAMLLSGLEFAQIGMGNEEGDEIALSVMKKHFDQHVAGLRFRYPGRRLIYIIQGLYAWLKRNENTKNREYVAAVRAEVVDQPPSQPKKRKTAKPAQQFRAITNDVVEDIQLYLQVQHQPLVIHHTTSDAATASQILAFTQSLSSRPYRVVELEHNLKSASFYMGAGQFKGGDDAQETFVRMLEEQQRVTPSIAQSIVFKYSSPRELVEAFRQNDNMLLENMRKSTNKDGGFSDKRIGPVISKRMHKVFLGRDPEATSGMS